MKVLARVEGLAVPAIIATAVHPKDTLVKITADRTVDKAGSNEFAIGTISVPSKSATAPNNTGTVETRFKELIECKIGGSALSAGAFVKLAAVDGTTGENVAVAWVSGTDVFERCFGIVWKGAAANGVAEILTF